MRPLCLPVLLLLSAAPAAAQDCPAPDPRQPERRYVNERFGIGFTYPTSFVLDPGSIPAGGDGARWWTADGRATVVLNAAQDDGGRSLGQLMAEAEGDVVENSGGEITYRRRRDNWFVLSGFMVGRIFYRRTLLTRDGVIATLWMEFPPEMRACLDTAVARMSLSFREVARPPWP